MSEYTRLTDLTGISESDDDFNVFWPLNVVLVLLGTAILTMAFYFLDPQDGRWLYNPWTYAVLTPIALVILSGVLSTLVSRVVEKSMQMAFLLSILVHLVLLVYAMNVVIFSRMWPDILESFSKQRHELQRQQLQANQYHRISVTNQTGRRPDYLSHVPTEHQPTEIEQADSPSLQLALAEKANLVSPMPEIELSTNPHLLKRNQPVPSRENSSKQAASLSRSELSRQLDARSSPEQLELRSANTPVESMRPSETRDRRRNQPTSRLDTPQTSPRPDASSSAPRIDRAERPVQSAAPSSETALSRSRHQSAPIGAPQILTPELASASQSQPRPMVNSSAELTARSRRNSMAIPNPVPDQPQINARNSPSVTRNLQRQSQWQVPQPSAGNSTTSLARDTAGGRSGMPAASSMPVQGVEMLAAESSFSSGEIAPRSSAIQRASSSRQQRSLTTVGAPTAPSWNGKPNLSSGSTGLSPAQLAQNAADGSAASNDIADLSGSGQSIERSALGRPGRRGELSVPLASELGTQSELSSSGSGTGQEPSELTPGSSQLRRASSGAVGPSSLTGIEPSGVTAQNRGIPNGLQRATDTLPAGSAPTEMVADSGGSIRSSTVGTAPGATPIEVPETASAGQPESSGSAMQPTLARSTRSSRTGPQSSMLTPLDIEASPGAGGVSPTPDRSGTLLPRRSLAGPSLTPTDLDAQRFARQDIGGPLAAGQQIAIPKPAFQQRIERLRDRNPLESTSAEPQTELAIERGLAFLAKNQRRDGSWRLQDYDTEVLMRSDTAATGLAVLAFQGAGYTHQQYKYAEVVNKALQFLREHQSEDGDLYIPQDPASDQNARLYSHGIAAIAMCEAYGMTQDQELKPAAQSAIDFMVASQDKERGGWRYQPGAGSDTSVTGWFMMALKSGELAGLDVPPETLTRLKFFLDASQVSPSERHLYRYNPYAADNAQQRHGLKPTSVMTSVGLLMRLYFGWQRDRPEMIAGTEHLLDNIPQHGTVERSRRDTYYWYYSTQVLFHMGGERWQQWHDTLYPLLIDNQVTQGEFEGSWNPNSPTPDLWARYGGRLYVTTMNLLSLEVSYRHLPLYDATASE